MRDGNYANSADAGNGPPGSPEQARRTQGWDVRPVSSWSLTIGQDPA